jgi:hypothetical protein
METVEADRDWHEDARRSEIEAETKKAATKYNWSAEKFETEFAKRWNFELQYGAGSIQTKALNRALRAAINLPTSVTREQVTKPWLVVGYQLTPDYSDPEVKRIVISAGLSASGDLYGGVPPQIAAPEPPPSGGPQPNTEPQEPPADVVAETFGEPDPEPEPEPPAPEPPAKEPEAAAEGQQSLEAETPEQVAARAAKVVLPFGRYKERTIGSVYEGTEQDAPDPGWIGWLSRTKDNGKPADDRARAAARAFVAVHPECLNKGDG